MHRVGCLLLHALPQEAPSVSDEDELTFVLAKVQRRKQVRRGPCELSKMCCRFSPTSSSMDLKGIMVIMPARVDLLPVRTFVAAACRRRHAPAGARDRIESGFAGGRQSGRSRSTSSRPN